MQPSSHLVRISGGAANVLEGTGDKLANAVSKYVSRYICAHRKNVAWQEFTVISRTYNNDYRTTIMTNVLQQLLNFRKSAMVNSAKPRTNKWLIGLGGSYVWLLWTSIARCYSVFYDPLLQHFNSDYSGASQINAFGFIGYGTSAVFAPLLLKRFGYRITVMSAGIVGSSAILIGSFLNNFVALNICIGLIPGLCMGPANVTYFFLICKFSDKTSSHLSQLLCLGGAVGPFVSCPLFQILIDSFGWRGALMIISGLFLNVAVTGATLLPDLQAVNYVTKADPLTSQCEISGHEDLVAQNNHKETFHQKMAAVSTLLKLPLLKKTAFWAYTMSSVGFSIAYFSTTTYIIPYAVQDLGIDEILASTLISGISAGDGVSKFMHGLFYARLSLPNRLLEIALSDLLMGLFLFLMAFSRSFAVLMFMSIMLGLVGGGISGDFILLPRDEFSIEEYTYVNGYCGIVTYALMSAGQVLSGFAIDSTGSSGTAFYIGGSFALCATLCKLLLFKVSKNRKNIMKKDDQSIML